MHFLVLCKTIKIDDHSFGTDAPPVAIAALQRLLVKAALNKLRLHSVVVFCFFAPFQTTLPFLTALFIIIGVAKAFVI